MSLNNAQTLWENVTSRLNSVGQWVPPLMIRLILFWEFYEAGSQKINGENWFSGIQSNFPFPFNHIPADVSWFMAAWGEYIFAILLLLGLFTRFAAVSLLVITAVATAAVHWPESYASLGQLWEGYAITNKGAGNFKLPLLFVILLLPLIFSGAGKFSLDHILTQFMKGDTHHPIQSDFISKGLGLIVIGLPLFFVMTTTGIAFMATGVVLMIADRFITPTG
ncbi:DoxX family protein [Marinicella litoralis]|uniref:Putative oxidoreductase n=1 Tax=Marinicella litoralis TaxID=644220 RepID=A0A4V6PXT1_9GAMM|nr:DoxX family protein [Marinicella litoralis]TDR16821.1 putative oxidoreductase [Marinicella litoralis]